MTTPDRSDTVALPAELLDRMLERCYDLEELKVVLAVGKVAGKAGANAVGWDSLCQPDIVRGVVGLHSPEPGERRLQRVLDRAVNDGYLFRVTIDGRGAVYLLGTPANKALIESVAAAQPDALAHLGVPDDAGVAVHRPTVFSVWEQEIGPLTPLIAEYLRDAERSYPRGWLQEAVRRAATNNRRSWAYVQSILRNWEAAGGPDV